MVDPMTPVVTLNLENLSGTPITSLSVFGLYQGERVTTRHVVDDFAQRSSQSITVGLRDEFPETYSANSVKGVVRFTDANGLRWERRSREAPIGLDSPASQDQDED